MILISFCNYLAKTSKKYGILVLGCNQNHSIVPHLESVIFSGLTFSYRLQCIKIIWNSVIALKLQSHFIGDREINSIHFLQKTRPIIVWPGGFSETVTWRQAARTRHSIACNGLSWQSEHTGHQHLSIALWRTCFRELVGTFIDYLLQRSVEIV